VGGETAEAGQTGGVAGGTCSRSRGLDMAPGVRNVAGPRATARAVRAMVPALATAPGLAMAPMLMGRDAGRERRGTQLGKTPVAALGGDGRRTAPMAGAVKGGRVPQHLIVLQRLLTQSPIKLSLHGSPVGALCPFSPAAPVPDQAHASGLSDCRSSPAWHFIAVRLTAIHLVARGEVAALELTIRDSSAIIEYVTGCLALAPAPLMEMNGSTPGLNAINGI
jgi:hypothetical protein